MNISSIILSDLYEDFFSALGKWVGFFGYKETPSIIITLSNNEKVVVTTNWPLRVKGVPDNFYYFLEKMKELNINIEKVEK